MTNNYSVGDSIDAWCTKCRIELEHTIVAMVDNIPKKVKCKTCSGQHNFRRKPAENKRTVSTRTARKVKTHEDRFNELLEHITGGDSSNARTYSMQGNFEKDEIIDHPKFGVGIVTSVINTNKIEITFKDGPKLLSQNQ